jgi:orotate phosphoribosyltransferase
VGQIVERSDTCDARGKLCFSPSRQSSGWGVNVDTEELLCLLAPRCGHFQLESGHHGDLWLDLDRLFARPVARGRFVAELARRLVVHGVEVVCGPSSGGAFLAQAVAFELETSFAFAERFIALPNRVRYRVPDGLRSLVRGKRVAVVDDAVNAGSAVRATIADLCACGAKPVAVGALLALGDSGPIFDLPFENLARLRSHLWVPADCPLCAASRPQAATRLKPSAPGMPARLDYPGRVGDHRRRGWVCRRASRRLTTWHREVSGAEKQRRRGIG